MVYRKQQPNLIDLIITTLVKGLWLLISWPVKKLLGIRSKDFRIDKIENHRKWLAIEKLAESDDEIHLQQAVIRADKLLDNILQYLGAQGKTFAHRLRNFEDRFNHKNYQAIWSAHRLRNKISHEEDYQTNIEKCKNALKDFKKALENLGAV